MSEVALRASSLPAALWQGRELPLTRNPAALFLARLAEGSRRVQRSALDGLAAAIGRRDSFPCEVFPWERLGYAEVQLARSLLLARGRAPATVNRHLAALKGVLRESFRLGLLSEAEWVRVRDVEGVRSARGLRGRQIPEGEMAKLFRACEVDFAGWRDAALLAVLYGGGLRRSEAVGLDLEDVDLERREVLVRHGKGRKERTVPLGFEAVEAVRGWVDVLASAGVRSGALFRRIRAGDVLTRSRLSAGGVDVIVKRRGAAVGVACSPHDFRRTFCSDELEAGADISTVQQLMGHSSVLTTQRYDRRGEAPKRRAVEMLHVPYRVKRS